MSELYLLRHAKAVPQEEGGPDRERPLEQRGRRAAQAVAQWIAEQRLAPALVLCSPSLRTRQTLDIVALAFPRLPQILIEDGLYLADAHRLLARLRRLPADTGSTLLVGHNPGFYDLATYLSEVAAGPLTARLGGFPTGALAGFQIEVPWAALDRRQARLIAVVLPKELLRGAD
ncbi:MAG TPA: histidine phosphatase family protein [Stellaceae bacterium]|nr:histidine phosphatase family protein [Stellaceae bacterium]